MILGKCGELPLSIKLVNSSPRKFVFSDHQTLRLKLGSQTMIAVLNLQPRFAWVFQEPNLPIHVLPDSRLLIRTPDLVDDDCISLNEEMALLPLLGKRPQGQQAVSSATSNSLPPLKHARVEQITQGNPVVMQDNPVVTQDNPVITDNSEKHQPFPLLYVCDMIPGMAALVSKSKLVDFRNAFVKHFPQCTFVRTTAYKHRLVYTCALKFGLIHQLKNYGRMDNGRWSALVSAVEKQHMFFFFHFRSTDL
jgi:hypothetical protein